MGDKITFLIGAGAEASFGVCTGDDFAKSVIFFEADEDKSGKERLAIIKLYYEDRYKTIIDNYSSIDSDNNEITSIEKLNLFENFYPSPKGYVFKDKGIYISSKAAYDIRKKFTENSEGCGSDNWFPELIDGEKRLTPEHMNKVYAEPNYMGVLDSRFYTIINPSILGEQKFWSVVYTYTSAYLKIVEGILKNVDEDTVREKLGHIKISNDIEKEDDKLRSSILYSYLYDFKKTSDLVNEEIEKKSDKDNYYTDIKNCIDTYNTEVNIISSNYTNFAKVILGDKFPIAYPNGKLDWFESAYELKSYHVNEISEVIDNDILFPYIFIQSGTKPIVESRQIKENYKVISYLEESNKLVVLGFNMNIDDNHINSLVREFITRNGTKLIFCSYRNKEEEFSSEQELYRIKSTLRLHNLDNIDDKIEIKILTNDNKDKVFEYIFTK